MFCLIAIWSALTLFKSKDEINIFLENWQSATYNGVDITAFYFMIGAFASFVVFSVILMYFLLFTKQLGKEKTIEEIIEVEEIIDEPREKVIETELYPEESVVEPDIPEDKVIEKKVSKALKTEEKSEPVKVIVEEEEDILKYKEATKEKIKQEEAKIASAKNEKKTSKRLSFEERLELADQDLKDIYSEIKKYIEGYGIKARMSKTGESYRLHTVRYLKITIAGKKLKLYYNLDPNKYKDTPIPFQDVSDKKVYKDIPFAFKVKSDLSIKRAKKLIDDMLENVELD